MKINKLNKTISKGVFLASCLATLSFSSLQAATFTADGDYQEFNNLIEVDGYASALNRGTLAFNNVTFGSKSGSDFNIAIDNALNTGTSEIYFNTSTVYAKHVSMGLSGSLARMEVIDTDFNIEYYAFLQNAAVLDFSGSNLTGGIRGDGTGILFLDSTNFVGYTENLGEIHFFGGSHWKSIGSSNVDIITINGYVNLEFVMTDASSIFVANAIGGLYGFNSVTINFSDDFIEDIMNGGGEGGWYLLDVLSTIVIPGVDWSMPIVATSNGTYEWDVIDYSSGYWGIENFRLVAIPEPSTYALIFGVLALGFAIYRRRK